jgi:signal transduction histidine kinase
MKLGEFIRNERTNIMSRWLVLARRASVTQDQPRSVVIDSLPDLLERIAENADAPIATASHRSPASVSRRHAYERIEQGYCLGEVVEEYTLLRACIFERLEELGLSIEPRENRQLNRALDEALRETTRRFVDVHERMLRALDRISAQPVARQSLAEVIASVLGAVRDIAAANVDSVSLFLLGSDGRFHLRATLGLEDDQSAGFSAAPGEGFVGTIAATGRPLLLRNAAMDPMIVSPAIRSRGTHALYGVPLTDDGRVIGVAHVGSMRASEFAEEDLLLFRAMANRAATVIVRAQFVEALEQTARFREQFMGILAHDLRNPLGAIRGTGQMLLLTNDLSPEQLRTAHQRIVRSATRMERLIGDVLDFTRARLGGGLPLTRAKVSLRDVAEEVVDELATRASQRQLIVEDGDDVVGSWDRERIAQVLSNLVSNAIEHSPDGSKVRVRMWVEHSRAIIEIANTGSAIPADLKAKLFEPFERTTTSGGLGLGLYISKEIAHAHGGSVDVRSDDDGTTFSVRLPLSPVA